jgi:hypothetical protein
LRNRYLSPATELAINKQVAKVHRGLGNPTPPLELAQVYELQKLDPQFYKTTADGVFRETFSRIRVGTIQVFKRPMLLLDAIKTLSLKALYVPDKKRILIDADLPKLKIRWNSAHEIAHSLFDWHEDVLFGDDVVTVTNECHEQIECEANYGAGRLLFLGDQLSEMVTGQQPTLNQLAELGKKFGNTWTSTLWRTVEALDVPAFAIIGSHPQHNPDGACRYFVRSREFERRFGTVDETDVLTFLQSYCSYKKTGQLGQDEVIVTDDNGEDHTFLLETFAHKWESLTFAQLVGSRTTLVSTSSGSFRINS